METCPSFKVEEHLEYLVTCNGIPAGAPVGAGSY